jgi:trk system potassium uptake protein
MLESQAGGKGLTQLHRKHFGMQGALITMALLSARYFFFIDSSMASDLVQGALLVQALVMLVATAYSAVKKRSVRGTLVYMFLGAAFAAAAVVSLNRAGADTEFYRLPVWGPVNAYLATLASISVFGSLIRLAGRVSPALLLPSSFLTVIFAGTILLMSPRATVSGIDPLNALFTATSATCVTGLIVLDTAVDFTFTGQLVILVLIQIGGLGLMSFAAFFAVTLWRNPGISHTAGITRILDTEFAGNLKQIVLSIVVWTLMIELAGTMLLYKAMSTEGPGGWSPGTTLWHSVFHSVSAFCNAGFSINSNNLESYSGTPMVPVVIGWLIILGGLGFVLLTVVGKNLLMRIRTGRKRPLPVQVRFVLLITGILAGLGCGLFLLMEWNNTLSGMSLTQKLANAFLQGVTPRTAGFNTVPTSELIPAVKWFFVLLMFIGASPGGTGGGVKTTTIGLLGVSLKSLIQQKKEPELWKRRIPIFDLQRAGGVLLLGLVTFSLSSLLLIAIETPSEDFQEMDYVFEAMSAFGTVGLSTGVTPHLSRPGRWVLILTMLVGRTAPATLAAATIRVRSASYMYPEARITIG